MSSEPQPIMWCSLDLTDDSFRQRNMSWIASMKASCKGSDRIGYIWPFVVRQILYCTNYRSECVMCSGFEWSFWNMPRTDIDIRWERSASGITIMHFDVWKQTVAVGLLSVVNEFWSLLYCSANEWFEVAVNVKFRREALFELCHHL